MTGTITPKRVAQNEPNYPPWNRPFLTNRPEGLPKHKTIDKENEIDKRIQAKIKRFAKKEYPDDYEMQIYSYEKLISEKDENEHNVISKETIDFEQKKNEVRIRIADLKEKKDEIEKIVLENSGSELITESEIIENRTAEINKTEEKILSPIKYKNNGENPAKTKDSNNNNFWSKLKYLWC